MRTLIVSSAFAALLCVAPSAVMAQGTGAFCLQKGQSQATNCSFQTMAQCEKSKVSQDDLCVRRADAKGDGPQTGGSTGMAPSGGMKK